MTESLSIYKCEVCMTLRLSALKFMTEFRNGKKKEFDHLFFSFNDFVLVVEMKITKIIFRNRDLDSVKR